MNEEGIEFNARDELTSPRLGGEADGETTGR